MKIFKNIAMLSCMALATAAFTSCSSSNNDEPEKPNTPSQSGVKVTVATEVITKATHINELTTGQEMNVYAKTARSVESTDMVSNIKGVRGSDGLWALTPEVYLGEKQTVVYFYGAYPYVAGANDPTKYPVDVNAQADVLYSGSAVACSKQTTTGRLKMKHALAMLCFDVDASNYSGSGKVSQVAVSGQGVMTTGVMNIENGEITPTAFGTVKAKSDANLKTPNSNPNIWVNGFKTTAQPATLTLTVDGKEYSATFPDVTIINEYQYGLHLILTDNGLVFLPGDYEKVSLNDGIEDAETPLLYGLIKITTSANELAFPIFTGSGVFGTAKSGNDMANYSLGGSIKLNGGGSKVVSIETWNTTGFNIPTIKDIDEIDLSAY